MTMKDILKATADFWNANAGGTYTTVARDLGVHPTTLQRRLAAAVKAGFSVSPPANGYTAARSVPLPEPTVAMGQPLDLPHMHIASMPEPDLPVEEIVAMRRREFEQKRAWEAANKLIEIDVKVRGPFGIWWFGDPHLDDDGTDIGAAFHHAELTRKYDWIFGANIGDTTNNWVGRYGHLYSQQNMGKSRALRVAQHWIETVKWLLVLDGNHDAWSGDDNPIQWMAYGRGLHRPDGARVELILPGGVEPFRIHARHDFPGHSMWNAGHGPLKSFHMRTRDHLKVSGHKHESFEGKIKDPETGAVCQLLKVASYKVHDRYGKQLDLGDQHLSPGAMTVIRPELPSSHPDRCKVFWDADEGVDYTKFAREKAGCSSESLRAAA